MADKIGAKVMEVLQCWDRVQADSDEWDALEAAMENLRAVVGYVVDEVCDG